MEKVKNILSVLPRYRNNLILKYTQLKKYLVKLKNYLLKFKKYLAKLIIYSLCIYQYIQLVIDYTKFEMNNQYRLEYYMEDITLTFCTEEDKLIVVENSYIMRNEEYSMKDGFFLTKRNYHGLLCYAFIKNDNFTYKLNSKLSSTVLKLSRNVLINYPATIYFIGHATNVPSHFGKVFHLKPKRLFYSAYIVHSKYTISQLLPWPYATDCYDYNSQNSLFKSREYCYLDVMRKLELKYCNVNKYWRVNEEYEKNASQCIKPNFDLLTKTCKVNCFDVNIEYEITKIELVIVKSENFEDFTVLLINKNENNQRIYLRYLPQFTLIELVSTMGGLLGLWLGLSLYDLFYTFFNLFAKLIFKLFRLSIMRLKLNKMHIILKILIISVMVINLQKLFFDFLSGQTQTKIDIVNENDLLDINFRNDPILVNNYCAHLMNNIVEQYPSIEKTLFEKYPEYNISNQNRISYWNTFLKEIFLKYGYDYYINQKFFGLTYNVSCSIINRNEESLDCSNDFKSLISISRYEFQIIHILKGKSILEKIDSKDILKIMLRFNIDDCYLKFVSLNENGFDKYQYLINVGTKFNIKFQKILLQKSISKKGCVWIKNNQTHDNFDCKRNYIKDIIMNKLKYKCIPKDIGMFHLDDLKLIGRNFCEDGKFLFTNLTRHVFKDMLKKCPDICENEFLSVEIDKKPLQGAIVINLIPKPNPKPIFTYSLSMDFNNFIYDVGGTIGMWVGYSALTLPNVIFEVVKDYQIIRRHFRRVFNF